MTKRPITIAFMDPATGTWVPLAHYASYERADRALERLSENFPNAYIEILDGALAAA